jgi:hypothetical protein
MLLEGAAELVVLHSAREFTNHLVCEATLDEQHLAEQLGEQVTRVGHLDRRH